MPMRSFTPKRNSACKQGTIPSFGLKHVQAGIGYDPVHRRRDGRSATARVLSTAVLDCSRSGSARTRLGGRFFLRGFDIGDGLLSDRRLSGCPETQHYAVYHCLSTFPAQAVYLPGSWDFRIRSTESMVFQLRVVARAPKSLSIWRLPGFV